AAAAMAMSSVSVVTNSLRLRGFRRPASAREITHPPLRQRVADWSYLVVIGLMAAGVGAVALWLAALNPAGRAAASDGHAGHDEAAVTLTETQIAGAHDVQVSAKELRFT